MSDYYSSPPPRSQTNLDEDPVTQLSPRKRVASPSSRERSTSVGSGSCNTEGDIVMSDQEEDGDTVVVKGRRIPVNKEAPTIAEARSDEFFSKQGWTDSQIISEQSVLQGKFRY